MASNLIFNRYANTHRRTNPHQGIDRASSESLADFVRRVVTPLLADRDDTRLEIDIDPGQSAVADPSLTAMLIESVTRASLHEMPQGGQLLITGVQTGEAFELEIADDGHPVSQRFQWRPLVAAKLGATLAWQDCPQGGVAVTIRFPRRDAAAGRIAA